MVLNILQAKREETMEKSRKRAFRRHHVDRLRDKRRGYWYKGDKTPKHLSQLAITPKPCSCYMCGNPRKHWNQDTIKEKLQCLVMKEELNE